MTFETVIPPSLSEMMDQRAMRQFQMHNMGQESQLRQLQMQQAQQGIEEDSQLRQLLPQLMQGGNPQEAISKLAMLGPKGMEMGKNVATYLDAMDKQQRTANIRKQVQGLEGGQQTGSQRQKIAQIYLENGDAESYQKIMPKVKDWKEFNFDGQIKYAPLFEDGSYGNPVDMKVAKKMHFIDSGGMAGIGVDEYTGKTLTPGIRKTATPGELMANARGVEANRLKAQENAINKDGIVSKRVMDAEMKLQDDYRTESKGFSETSTAMKKILGAIETADKNPGSALAAGTAFMKLLDPNSVVRESELGMALNASGWFDRATNIANQLQNGKIMTAQQKVNLKAAANDLFTEAKAAQLEVDAAYRKRATDYGASPERVIVDRGQNNVQRPVEKPQLNSNQVALPNGSVKTFPNPAAAQAFRKAAGL